MCRGDGTNTIQLVQALPQGTGTDGTEARHEGVATSHCEMDSSQVLHRRRNVVTWLATFFLRLYPALSVRACAKRKTPFWIVVPLPMHLRCNGE